MILTLLFNSCTTIRLISEYDEMTDKAITALQEKVTTTLVKIERNVGTTDANYEKFKSFYEEAKVGLNTVKIRAAAFDKNKIVEEQLKIIGDNIDILEQLHKMGFKKREETDGLKSAFDAAFTTMIQLQIALKRGK